MNSENDEAMLAIRMLREEVNALAQGIPGAVSNGSLRVGDIEIQVGWEPPAVAVAPPTPVVPVAPPTPAATLAPVEAVLADADDGIRTVVAPLVGTFYIASEPGADPFVQPGDTVEPGQPIGIVEAMKLMNHVPSEWLGEVVEVLVKNGEPVEFGQELVRIRVADQ